MSALTSLLVRDGVVPVRKIEEALQRQVISGGDVETVLLEMDALPENVLAGYRAALLELPPVTREQVMGVRPDIISLVPAEVATTHRVIPLEVEGRTLHLAAHEPLTPEQEEQLGFLLGFDLLIHVACEMRIAAGLAHHYGAELAPRTIRLIDKVRRRDSGALPEVGKVARGKLSGHASDIPVKDAPVEGVKDTRYVRRRRSSSGMLLEPAPPESEPPDPKPSLPVRRSVPATEGSGYEVSGKDEAAAAQPLTLFSGRRRIRGPMTLARGERLLRQATDRDQIIEVFFEFARQLFDYTALFVVHDDVADGRVAYGTGATTEEMQALEVPLDRPSAFSEVRRTLASQVTRLDRTDVDRDIAVALHRRDAQPAMVMPIAIRRRVVLILYGDRDGETFDIGAVMELVRFGPRVVEAFEQLILRRKGAGYHRTETEEPELREERESLKEAARSVSRTAGSSRPSSPPAESGKWQPGRRSVPPFAPDDSVEDDSWGSVVRAPQPVHAVPVAPRVGLPHHAVVEPRSLPPDAPPSAVLGIPREAPPPPATSLDLGESDFDDDEDEPELTFDAEDDLIEEDDPSFGFDDEEPELLLEVDHEADDFEDEDEEPLPPSHDRVSYRPTVEVGSAGPPDAETSDGKPPRPDGTYRLTDASVEVVRAQSLRSPPRGLDADTRSVIVDMGDQVHSLVEELLRTSSASRQQELVQGLLSLGEVALPVLVQAFPGPLHWSREDGGPVPRASEISAVAGAVVAFGERAAPYVSALLSSAHPDVRFYAAAITSELVHPEVMAAVAERIHDEDEGVRQMALQLLPRFSAFRGFGEIQTVIRRTARLRGKDLSRRWQAVDAIAALGDVEILPRLIDLLNEDDDVLVQRLERALVVLTGADFGRSHRRWLAWWRRNERRHRVEWLIEGLTHADEHVRRIAGEEIKRLTQEYYGYHPGSPKRDRERVAKKYRQWWEDEGRRRFARQTGG